MMKAISDFSKSNEVCAVAIGKENKDITHCGILYSFEDIEKVNYYFLHLGDPLHLHNNVAFSDTCYEKERPHYVWDTLKTTVFIQNLIKSRCHSIALENKSLPYGILHDETTHFDGKAQLKLGPEASGLTCSSLVKTILKNCGFNIIDDVDWPDDRESDVLWAKYLVNQYTDSIKKLRIGLQDINKQIRKLNKTSAAYIILAEKSKKLTHYIQVLTDTRNQISHDLKFEFKRFRPEEVSASSYLAFEKTPIRFKYPDGNPGAEKIGEDLRSILITPIVNPKN